MRVPVTAAVVGALLFTLAAAAPSAVDAKPRPKPSPSPSATPRPTPTPSPTPTATPAPSPTTSPVYLEGIDVSYHQGTIDWQRVAGADKRFAFIRATAGALTADTAYAANHAGALAAGLAVGSYHFANPDFAANDAANEASWFLRNATIASGDLGVRNHRRQADHLHDPDVLVEFDGEHGVVRPERLFRPVDRELDGGGRAHRARRLLGRQRLDVLAALELRRRAWSHGRGRPRSVPGDVPAVVAVRALTASRTGTG
jgi:hypothetical protein